ncbi:MAG: Rrf2 family transcriptional regulator [Planctomycetota bacterium]
MLSQTAEYALRAVAALAPNAGQLVPTTDLAKQADVPPPYLAKVLQQLAAAKIIRGRRGVGGGYTLNRPADEINLLEVVTAVGPLREPKTTEQIMAMGDGLHDLHELIDGSADVLRRRLEGTSVADVARAGTETPAEQPSRANAPQHAGQNGTVNGQAQRSNGSRNGHTNGSMDRAGSFSR